MNKKMKWKRLRIGFLCMMLLASNVVSVFAEDTDAGIATVSGNDDNGGAEETETGENGTGKSEEKETDKEQDGKINEKTGAEDDIGCEHEYHYIPNNDGTHTVTCINCDLEETENGILTENAEEGQNCEKCGFITETGDDTEIEDSPQLFSLETDGYDVSAADRTYTAGENITAYYFESDGTLLFEGTGPMTEWGSDSDVPWDNETINTAIVGEGITTLGAYALCYHQELTTVTLPDTLKAIGDYAVCETYWYYGTRGNLKNIDIPDGVERIGTFAFRGNALEKIIIPDSVTDIGENAFGECRDVESLSIGSGLSEIKERTFSELINLKTIRIPGNVETIQEMAFRKTGATEIIISDGVKVIGESAFEPCENAEVITLGNSVEMIGKRAFSECKSLKSLVIPDSVVTIESNAFKSCNSLSDLTFGSGLLTIGNYAFEGAHVLEHLEIPDNVMDIASNAFSDSRALKNISIGSGITRLGYKVFFVEDITKTNVETDNKTALNYDWAGDGREVTFKSKVIFKDHAGNSLLELLLEHGETVLDKAPAMEDYEDGGYTYVFTGWEPEITEDTRVTGGAEYTPKYSIPGKGTATFRNYDGTVLKEVLLSYGETILDKAPSASREAEGRNTYIFSGWSPALGETDELIGDVTYAATYKRKTQTGIQVSHDINIPEGTSISDSNITVFPIYKVYDENNKLIEMIRNEDDVIADDDIRFSKDRIERESNEITVEQISTGLTITAEIFGSYIDGIAVWQPPEELEAGTELKELEIYFTRTIEDKAGFIENGLIDPSKKVGDYELNEDDSVTIEEGDNEIRVTEKETGDDHESTVHIKGIPKKPEEVVSGNDPGDGKEDDVSGNDPTDGKEDEVSGNDPSDGKEEDGTSTEDPDRPDKEQDNSSKDTETDTKPSDGTPFYTPVSPDKSGPCVKSENRWEVPEEYEEDNENKGSTDIIKVGPVKTGDSFSLWKYVRAAFVSAFVSVFVWLCFTTNLLSYIRLLTGHIFLKGKKRKFHGILTRERNPFIVVDAPDGMEETVQDVIGQTEDVAACIKRLKESGAVTYLPFETKMTLSYKGENSSLKSVSMEADENKLYDTLESLHGRGEVTVRFSNDAVKINIKLNYQV